MVTECCCHTLRSTVLRRQAWRVLLFRCGGVQLLKWRFLYHMSNTLLCVRFNNTTWANRFLLPQQSEEGHHKQAHFSTNHYAHVLCWNLQKENRICFISLKKKTHFAQLPSAAYMQALQHSEQRAADSVGWVWHLSDVNDQSLADEQVFSKTNKNINFKNLYDIEATKNSGKCN